MNIQLPQLQLPPIEGLSTLLSIIPLVIIVALILITLTARSIIHSRAFTILAVAAIFIGGSASIVGGLHALAIVIGVSGLSAIGLIITLGRHPQVLDMTRQLIDRRMPVQTMTYIAPPSQKQIAAPSNRKQLPAGKSIKIPRGMGFD